MLKNGDGVTLALYLFRYTIFLERIVFANSRSKLFKLSLPGFGGASLALNARPALTGAKPVTPFAKVKTLPAWRR